MQQVNQWQLVLDSTGKGIIQGIQFQSFGNYSFDLRRKLKSNLTSAGVIECIQKQYQLQAEDFNQEHHQQAKTLKQVLELSNIHLKGDYNHILLQKNIDLLSEVIVLVNDGNTAIIRFQDHQHYYVIFYETS